MRLLLYFLSLFSVFIFSEYKNSDGKAINKSFKELMQWQRSKIEPNLSYIDISEDWKNYDLENHDNFIIWIGHSTFLIKRNGITIITDPIFSDRASPFRNIGPKRIIPPALSLEDIPKIDFVTVSHNHYDHLDIQSLVKISKLHPNAKFLVPAGDLKLLKRKKIQNLVVACSALKEKYRSILNVKEDYLVYLKILKKVLIVSYNLKSLVSKNFLIFFY